MKDLTPEQLRDIIKQYLIDNLKIEVNVDAGIYLEIVLKIEDEVIVQCPETL